MKKILIGLAAGALAVVATGAGSASADTVYEQITDGSSIAETLIDASGLDSVLDDCGTGSNAGLPDYTVFFPNRDAIFGYVLDALDMSLGQLAAQPALVKQVLLYHVHKGSISPEQLAKQSTTSIPTMGGLTLIKTTQLDALFSWNPFSFTDLESGLTTSEKSAIAAYGVADLDNFKLPIAAIPVEIPTAISYSVNGYSITNLSRALTYTVDLNTWYADGVTNAVFATHLTAAQDDLLADLAAAGTNQTLIKAAFAAFYGDLLADLAIADDLPEIDTDVVSGPAPACNGYVYYIDGLLSPSSATDTQGLTADGSVSTAPAATGDGLPATGSESMALTYAALASLIAGAGVLVLRRRSVA